MDTHPTSLLEAEDHITFPRVLSRRTSRSEQLRQLTAQLASLASLEDVVARGFQSLLESLAELVALVSVAERAHTCFAPAASLTLALSSPQSCSRSASRLHPAQPAWSHWPGFQELPPRPRLSALSPRTAAPAPRPLPLALSNLRARPVRPTLPPCPRTAPRLLTPVRLPPGWLVRGVPWAPLSLRRRSRDKRRRRTRRPSKQHEIWRQVFVRSAMWACCGDTSSDDDSNKENSFPRRRRTKCASRRTGSPHRDRIRGAEGFWSQERQRTHWQKIHLLGSGFRVRQDIGEHTTKMSVAQHFFGHVLCRGLIELFCESCHFDEDEKFDSIS